MAALHTFHPSMGARGEFTSRWPFADPAAGPFITNELACVSIFKLFSGIPKLLSEHKMFPPWRTRPNSLWATLFGLEARLSSTQWFKPLHIGPLRRLLPTSFFHLGEKYAEILFNTFFLQLLQVHLLLSLVSFRSRCSWVLFHCLAQKSKKD